MKKEMEAKKEQEIVDAFIREYNKQIPNGDLHEELKALSDSIMSKIFTAHNTGLINVRERPITKVEKEDCIKNGVPIEIYTQYKFTQLKNIESVVISSPSYLTDSIITEQKSEVIEEPTLSSVFYKLTSFFYFLYRYENPLLIFCGLLILIQVIYLLIS